MNINGKKNKKISKKEYNLSIRVSDSQIAFLESLQKSIIMQTGIDVTVGAVLRKIIEDARLQRVAANIGVDLMTINSMPTERVQRTKINKKPPLI